MNSQHYFKKLDKFAVCAFKAEKGCIEVELKSESCGIYHYVFYGSAKIGKVFESGFEIIKKGDFFSMKDYLYQPRIYEALEDVYVWGFNKFPKVSESIFENAALFGAKTVNGPSLDSAPTKSAAFNAVTKVEKSLFDSAASTIV